MTVFIKTAQRPPPSKDPSHGGKRQRTKTRISFILTRTYRTFSTLFLIALVSFLTIFKTSAADVYWTNAAGGNWSVPANWSTGALPGAGDNVFIVSNGTYT